MALGDVFKLVLDGLYLGEKVSNVFWYSQTETPVEPDDEPSELALGFEFVFRTPLENIANDQMIYNRITVTRISDGAQSELPINWVGAIDSAGGDSCMPSYVALAFRMNRTNAAQRNGYKRFSGISETWVAGNGLQEAFTSQILAVVGALEEFLISPTAGTFAPCVVTRPVTLGSNPAYYNYNSAQFNAVTTQNSRKA